MKFYFIFWLDIKNNITNRIFRLRTQIRLQCPSHILKTSCLFDTPIRVYITFLSYIAEQNIIIIIIVLRQKLEEKNIRL